MNLTELVREVRNVAEIGGDPARCEALVRETHALADMVSWAIGPIDPRGEWLDRLAEMQADLEVRHAQTSDPMLALLHDSLTDLGRAIVRHDEDLETHRAHDEDGDEP